MWYHLVSKTCSCIPFEQKGVAEPFLWYLSFLGRGEQLRVPHDLHIERVLQRPQNSKMYHAAE